MENSIEKDIEKVENLIKKCDECKLKECINCETNWTEITSIKRIVDSYKKVLKENEELKENDNKYTIHLTDEQYNMVIEIVQDDINRKWIQKLKDKIEELNKLLTDIDYKDIEDKQEREFYKKEYYQVVAQIKVLKELLKEEE